MRAKYRIAWLPVDVAAAGDLFIAGKEHEFPPFSAEVKAILDAGGLVEYTKHKLGSSS